MLYQLISIEDPCVGRSHSQGLEFRGHTRVIKDTAAAVLRLFPRAVVWLQVFLVESPGGPRVSVLRGGSV